VTFALTLAAAAVLAPLLAPWAGRAWALRLAVALGIVGLALDAVPRFDLARVADAVGRVEVLDIGAGGGTLLLASLLWCGPAADLLVRRVLDATGLPAPEAAAAAGLGAGRWIGRLERWMLVLCVGAGQPALAVLPIGGKALFRYAEVVADARAERPRLTRADGTPGGGVTRDALLDYVIVGSLASWAQAITLGLLVAA
jgi:hypothetical protein